MEQQDMTFRSDVSVADAYAVRRIVESSGFFSAEEADIAVELVNEALTKGADSGYAFLFAEDGGRTVAYSCFGQIACTALSYTLYWLAVDQDYRHKGFGKCLLRLTEECIFQQQGGRCLYLDTSSRPQYAPTRRFYLSCGYQEAALLPDFYAPGDGKIIYFKVNPAL